MHYHCIELFELSFTRRLVGISYKRSTAMPSLGFENNNEKRVV